MVVLIMQPQPRRFLPHLQAAVVAVEQARTVLPIPVAEELQTAHPHLDMVARALSFFDTLTHSPI